MLGKRRSGRADGNYALTTMLGGGKLEGAKHLQREYHVDLVVQVVDFGRLDAGTVLSNPAQVTCVCPRLSFFVAMSCVDRDLATGRTAIQRLLRKVEKRGSETARRGGLGSEPHSLTT